jgi:hypothetical protein
LDDDFIDDEDVEGCEDDEFASDMMLYDGGTSNNF